MKILIIEENAIVALGLENLVGKLYNNAIISVFKNSEEALLLSKSFVYDLVILDLNGPNHNDFNLIDALKKSKKNVKILLYSEFDLRLYFSRFFKVGIHGIVEKGASCDDFIMAIKTVIGGYLFFKNDLLASIFKKEAPSSSLVAQLTKREYEILNYLLNGLSLKEIGQKNNLKPSTISTLKARAFLKLGVTNTIELYQFFYHQDKINDRLVVA